MNLVRLVDSGITHGVMTTSRTWCGRTYAADSFFLFDSGAECQSCKRAMEGPLGPNAPHPALIAQLVSAFPAVFIGVPILVIKEGHKVQLTGYLQAGTANTHAHYIGPAEAIPVIHEHRGGRRAHDHPEERDA